jgi:hypothetical protein
VPPGGRIDPLLHEDAQAGPVERAVLPDEYEARMTYTNDQPLPVTIVAIFPSLETKDDG